MWLAVFGESLHKGRLRNVGRQLVGCSRCKRGFCPGGLAVGFKVVPIAIAAHRQAVAQREQDNQGIFQCGLHPGKDTTFIFGAKKAPLMTQNRQLNPHCKLLAKRSQMC